jgi:diguanylate cyclase
MVRVRTECCHGFTALTVVLATRDFEATRIVLQALSTMGVRIAVDDFGTGYSNLSYLKRFPINTLKLEDTSVTVPDAKQ